MIIFQSIGFVILTLAPGLLAVRLLRNKRLHGLDTILYAVGFGLLFNLAVGLVANFTFGITVLPVLIVYVVMLGILGLLSWRFGISPQYLKWQGWKPISIPLIVYLVAVALQLQTTLQSYSLIGSDIQLEYFYSNWTLNDGCWNPTYSFTTMTSALGITVLLPVYKLLTGMDLVWVYKLIMPMMFAVVPLVLYRIFSRQFGMTISLLAVAFFATMPMYTMDSAQLIRQEQSVLFFVLVVLAVLDDNLSNRMKLLLGGLFAIGAVTMHYGMVIGFIGYVFIGSFVAVALRWLWRKKDIIDLRQPLYSRFVFLGIAVIAVLVYAGYYSVVNNKLSMWASSIPVTIVQRTTTEAQAGVSNEPMESITTSKDLNRTYLEAPPEVKEEIHVPAFFEKFPFLNPFWREPLVQTAIGLDFARASTLGKTWRILQYLVELCLIVGFFVLLLRPPKGIKLEYMAMVIASFFILAGLYVLSTYSYGMGVVRIWQITLLFMSPCFVYGVSLFSRQRFVLWGTLILFIPYYLFNSGIVFEAAKLQPSGFIDVPYSIALSGHRIDLAGIFTKEDVEAVDWLKENIGDGVVYADANGVKLLIQRMGIIQDFDLGTSTAGQVRMLEKMKPDAGGYIYMRKWNMDTDTFTFQGEYGSRVRHGIQDLKMIDDKLSKGNMVFDNGARLILVE